jgi:mannose-6-phosphate isomerase
MPIYPLKNKIQTYAWGSKTAIAELLGSPSPADVPQAELWMGTHPKGPSSVVTAGEQSSLSALIGRQPAALLGRSVVDRFGPELPFLFKVLAAAHPLSIQAHPDKKQAKEGFGREEREGIPVDAPHRNYRDENHKPEIICALTPFWGLNGFRPVKTIVSLLTPVFPKSLEKDLSELKTAGPQGLRAFFAALMTLSQKERSMAVKEIHEKAKALAGTSSVYYWMEKLAAFYPSDMGSLGPGLLQLVCLSPGQAMYLPAGQLHAYLDGVGIELMANSDNVLRGGLTTKHVDVPELLRVVRFEETEIRILEPVQLKDSSSGYECPAKEFTLSIIQTDGERCYRSPSTRSVEILLCTEGRGTIDSGATNESAAVQQGDSFLIPAGLPFYTIRGHTTIYKASVPIPAGI